MEKIQSKWDLENVPRAALELNSTKLDDVVPTSKAVSWPKVRNWIVDKSHVNVILLDTFFFSFYFVQIII